MEDLINRWKQLDGEGRLRFAQSVVLDLISSDAQNDDQYIHTEFSKWAYFKQKYRIGGVESQTIYTFRKELKLFLKEKESYLKKEELLLLIDNVVSGVEGLIENNTRWKTDPELVKEFDLNSKLQISLTRELRLLVTKRIDEEHFLCERDDDAESIKLVFPEDAKFIGQPMTDCFGKLLSFPFFIYAFDINWIDEVAHPEYFVLVPDYLIDVTSIAAGFSNKEFTPWIYFHHKLLPRSTTYHMMLGNIVNMILDRMIEDSSLKLQDVYPMIFRRNLVQINQMNDGEVRKLMSDVQFHFGNLKNAVQNGFQKLGIALEHCALEPSFLSNKYGIQGRLDVLYQGDQVSIIELKSGKPFRPNSYGIKSDHYVQTLLYDLLLKSAGVSYNSRNFILYSSQSEKALRYAPPLKAVQIEALQARNEIFLLDSIFSSKDRLEFEKLIRTYLSIDLHAINPFVKRDGEIIKKTIQSSGKIHWSYYQEFLSFVQREMMVAKLGQVGLHEKSGHAGLWLKSKEEKENEFSLLYQLQFENLNRGDEEVLLHFKFTDSTNPLANFRTGDVVVLYPDLEEDKNVLHHQVVKASIIGMTGDQIVFRARSNQLERRLFEQRPLWNAERDVLDSSFKSMFDSLFLFLHHPSALKNMWMGISPPREPIDDYPDQFEFSEGVLDSQKEVVKRAYQSQDYFLIWGPPGTGKTSIVLREIVRMYIENGNEDLYLISYTNRAVDEICHMVSLLDESYTQLSSRLGSRYSVGKEYSDLLFSQQSKTISNRDDMKKYLASKRIFISTLSSFWGQKSLVQDKENSILIVDEASQILEPSIVGLFSNFKKVILIGDHLQLPAVSLQNDATSIIRDEGLTDLGISSTKTSLFHRLYRRCQYKNWHHALGMLYHQGRMHKDIMSFANEQFYNEQLSVIPNIDRLVEKTGVPRLIYIPSQAFPFQSMLKNNVDEAEKVVDLIRNYLEENQLDISEVENSKIGVITPFRAQIALIKNLMSQNFGSKASHITVDTVERYQGSARDIIVISACLNRRSQLLSISSIGEEGVDRKFNVALTRARERVILIGNQDILLMSESYREYISVASRY